MNASSQQSHKNVIKTGNPMAKPSRWIQAIDSPSISVENVHEEIREAFGAAMPITRKCTSAINALFMLSIRQEIPSDVLKDMYVMILRSFQSDEMYLKYMVYFIISLLGKKTSNAFLGISCLCKDMGDVDDKAKPWCLKSLFSVLPDSMLNDYKRILLRSWRSKKDDLVNMSMAIYYDMLSHNKARNWVLDFSEMRGLLGLGVVYESRKGDRLFLLKYLKGIRESLRSDETLFFIRLVFLLINDDRKLCHELIRGFLSLRSGKEMTFIEAANCVADLDEEDGAVFLDDIVLSLKALLLSNDEILRFSSLRILNKLMMKHPDSCKVVIPEIEDLIGSDNKSVNTMAATAILLTDNSSLVDGLINKVIASMDELKDSHKTTLVEAIVRLCKRSPGRTQEFRSLFKVALEKEADLEFKIFLVREMAKIALHDRKFFVDMLSTYIEDSQYTRLTVEILGILGREIPQCKNPWKYVVRIFNRIMLDCRDVRFASLLALFNICKSSCRPNDDVIRIVKRCHDSKDALMAETVRFLVRNGDLAVIDELRSEDLGEFSHLIPEAKKQGSAKTDEIKTCREILLTSKGSDVKITLTKTIFESMVKMQLECENTLPDTVLRHGDIVIHGSNGDNKEEHRFTFENIGMGVSKSVEFDTLLGEGAKFMSSLEYQISSENDPGDSEHERIELIPFGISLVDYFRPSNPEFELPLSRSISFTFDSKDVNEVMQIALRFFSLKIISQKHENGVQVTLGGTRGGIGLRVNIDLWAGDTVCGNFDIFGNDEYCIDNLVTGLFE